MDAWITERGTIMPPQEVIFQNIKTAKYKPVDMNQAFDPENPHSRSYAFDISSVSSPLRGNKLFVTSYSLPPGKSNYPYHYHAGMEEVFYIVSGKGVLETPKGETEVSEGDVIVFPAGENGAHRLTNPSADTPLLYLDVDTGSTPEVVFYPHTNKIRVMSERFQKSFLLDSEVNYLKDE